jgi:hypothetical protein
MMNAVVVVVVVVVSTDIECISMLNATPVVEQFPMFDQSHEIQKQV